MFAGVKVNHRVPNLCPLNDNYKRHFDKSIESLSDIKPFWFVIITTMLRSSSILKIGIGLLVLSLSSLCAVNGVSAETDTKNVDIVILVDESTSLSAEDVAREQEAVENIINLPKLKDQSIRIQILPFSSGSTSPRLLPVCDLTELDIAGVAFLSEKCLPQIRRESSDSGSNGAGNTDFASAIDTALSVLFEKNDPGRRKAILLLTDGRFDPTGNGEPSIAEQQSFGSVLGRAEKERVQIWPLGFGDKVEFFALTDYAAKGYQGEKNCPRPRPEIADPDKLGTLVYTMIGAITCSDIPPPQPTPSDIVVHPFVDRLSISVFDSASEPAVKGPDGTIECADQWEKKGTRYLCQLVLDGSQPGVWNVFGSDGSKVVSQISGSVKISLNDCDSKPTLTVVRSDDNPTQWDTKVEWPEVEISQFDKTGAELGDPLLLSLSQEKQQISIISSASVLRAGIADDSPVSEISLLDSVECAIASSATTTSTVSSTKPSVPESPEGEPKEPPTDPPGFPWWILGLIGLVFVLTVLIVARKARARKRFTYSMTVRQMNPKSGKFVITPSVDLDGCKEFGLRKNENTGLMWGVDVSEAQIVFRRDRDEVIVRKVVDKDESDFVNKADMNVESRFSFNYEFEFDGGRFIVEMEEDFDQDDEENE